MAVPAPSLVSWLRPMASGIIMAARRGFRCPRRGLSRNLRLTTMHPPGCATLCLASARRRRCGRARGSTSGCGGGRGRCAVPEIYSRNANTSRSAPTHPGSPTRTVPAAGRPDECSGAYSSVDEHCPIDYVHSPSALVAGQLLIVSHVLFWHTNPLCLLLCWFAPLLIAHAYRACNFMSTIIFSTTFVFTFLGLIITCRTHR